MLHPVFTVLCLKTGGTHGTRPSILERNVGNGLVPFTSHVEIIHDDFRDL